MNLHFDFKRGVITIREEYRQRNRVKRMSFGGYSRTTVDTTQKEASSTNDVLLNNGPVDTVTALRFVCSGGWRVGYKVIYKLTKGINIFFNSKTRFSSKANNLLATSWDRHAYCYRIQDNGANELAAKLDFGAPTLCCDWETSGNTSFVGGADNKAYMWDLATNQKKQVGQHDYAVSGMSVRLRHTYFI